MNTLEDLWVAYFKNGKSVQHEAEITYPKFNEPETNQPSF